MALILQIDALSFGGDGVARDRGQVVFVPGGVPGDRVEVEVVGEADRSLRARLLRVVEPSPDRVAPGCPRFGACGGCQWMQVSAEAQARAKESIFYDALARIGGVARSALSANPLLRSPRTLRYRHKARLRACGLRLGFSARASHDLVEIDDCLLLGEALGVSLPKLREALAAEGPVPRCTAIGIAAVGSRATAAFHVDGACRASGHERAERILRRAGFEGGVVVPSEGAVRPIGRPVLAAPAPRAPGVSLLGRADLFAQANAEANLALVSEVLRLAGSPAEVLELFCGAGNLTFALAAAGARVTGVEQAAEAVELARRSAREASERRVRFVVGDALKVGWALAREGRTAEVLVLDPPRTGARGVGALARRLGVRRVVYVSCDPATLARDARELVAEGYLPKEATPLDLFPQTFHVEGVLALELA